MNALEAMNKNEYHFGILFHMDPNHTGVADNDKKMFDGYCCIETLGDHDVSSKIHKFCHNKNIKKLFLWYGGTAFRVI